MPKGKAVVKVTVSKKKMAPKPKVRKNRGPIQRPKGMTVPAARANAVRAPRQQSPRMVKPSIDRIDTIQLTNSIKAGDVLGVYPVCPAFYGATGMAKDAQMYLRYLAKKALLKMTSAAPSSATGRIAIAYCSDPNFDLDIPPNQRLTELARMPGFVDMPVVGYRDTVCAAKFEPRGMQDALYTSTDFSGEDLRFLWQGKFIVLASADMAGFTGSTSLGIYLDTLIEFSQPVVRNPGSNQPVILPVGSYQVTSTGHLVKGDGTNLDADLLALFSGNGYYTVAPALLGELFSSGDPCVYLYLYTDGYIYPAATKANAQSHGSHVPGTGTAVSVLEPMECIWHDPNTRVQFDAITHAVRGRSYVVEQRAARALRLTGNDALAEKFEQLMAGHLKSGAVSVPKLPGN